MISAIDTNIVLDILIPGAPHARATALVLEEARHRGRLVLSEPVYAEIASVFPSFEECRRFLTLADFIVIPSSEEGLFLAGERWRSYTRNGPPMVCRNCGAHLEGRQHLVADFLIGAHAITHADQLITRDHGFFRTYFSGLKLVEP